MTSESWTARATPENAGELRRSAVAFASAHDVLDPPINELRLALAEAINNAVVHAFGDGPPGCITVAVGIDPENRQLRASVRDDGRGLRPRSDSPGLGLGLPLMSTLADSIDLRCLTGGTEVSMTFALAPAPAA